MAIGCASTAEHSAITQPQAGLEHIVAWRCVHCARPGGRVIEGGLKGCSVVCDAVCRGIIWWVGDDRAVGYKWDAFGKPGPPNEVVAATTAKAVACECVATVFVGIQASLEIAGLAADAIGEGAANADCCVAHSVGAGVIGTGACAG